MYNIFPLARRDLLIDRKKKHIYSIEHHGKFSVLFLT